MSGSRACFMLLGLPQSIYPSFTRPILDHTGKESSSNDIIWWRHHFQLIAVSIPTVLFHLYASKVGLDICKIEDAEVLMKSLKDEDILVNQLNEEQVKKLSKLKKRKKNVGKYKTRTIYRGNNVKSVMTSSTRDQVVTTSMCFRFLIRKSWWLDTYLTWFVDFSLSWLLSSYQSLCTTLRLVMT